MDIFLINLDRSPERLAHMAALFDELALDFTRISAVDGPKLIAEGKLALPAREGFVYKLGAGEVGCYLSHVRFWETVVSGTSEWAAVFEDDVHLGPGLRDLVVDDRWIPADADIIKLETTSAATILDRRRSGTVAGRTVRRLWGAHTGTAGYLISRAGARKLLELSAEIYDPVDQFMFNPEGAGWKNTTVYQLTPAICIQDMFLGNASAQSLQSTLAKERPASEKPGAVEKLIREVSRPFRQASAKLRAMSRGREITKVPFA